MEYAKVKEIFADVLPIIYKAAPSIGSYLGSPATNTIIGLLAAIVSANPCDECDLSKKLKNDADLFAKLANLEATHGEWIKSLN